VAAFDVVLIADQAETAQGGVVTPAVRELLAALAPAHPEKVFLADSRARIHLFRRLAIKPNRQEAEAAAPDLATLRRVTQAPLVMVTHGGEGVLVLDDGGERWVRARPVAHPVDICGAGDSFAAGAALTLAVTRSAEDAARVGNLVASVTIMKKGTGTASPAEVLAAEHA
jgi:sugar/nucleoside kinase (ribokinase family)